MQQALQAVAGKRQRIVIEAIILLLARLETSSVKQFGEDKRVFEVTAMTLNYIWDRMGEIAKDPEYRSISAVGNA